MKNDISMNVDIAEEESGVLTITFKEYPSPENILEIYPKIMKYIAGINNYLTREIKEYQEISSFLVQYSKLLKVYKGIPENAFYSLERCTDKKVLKDIYEIKSIFFKAEQMIINLLNETDDFDIIQEIFYSITFNPFFMEPSGQDAAILYYKERSSQKYTNLEEILVFLTNYINNEELDTKNKFLDELKNYLAKYSKQPIEYNNTISLVI